MYRCKSCSALIGNTVRINCAVCPKFDLCVTCFCQAREVEDHKCNHEYRVMDQFTFPLFTQDWCADEEELLIEAAQTHGLGNWKDIAAYVGSRTKEECEEHYRNVYINADNFIPDMKKTFEGVDERTMRDRKRKRMNVIQQSSRPKRRNNLQSLPATHEVQGYMPLRLEFETEPDNDAEMMIKDIDFDNNAPEDEVKLKLTLLEIYNKKLKRREEKKRLIFDHELLEYKKMTNSEKKRTKEERDLIGKLKVFAKLMNKKDYDKFVKGMIDEMNLRAEVAKLQEWRRKGISTEKDGQRYESEKLQKQQAANRDAQAHLHNIISDRLFNKQSRRTEEQTTSRPMRKQSSPIDLDHAECVHMLSPQEKTLCSHLRIYPKPYLVIKETILKAYARRGFNLKKREARDLIKIDVNKTSLIYDFFIEMKWIKNQATTVSLSSRIPTATPNGAVIPGSSATTNSSVVSGV